MVLNFNVRLFCENLRATKPPYECPVENCGKVYRTYTGIENHMYNYDHGNVAVPSTAADVTPTSVSGQRSRIGSTWRQQRSVSLPSQPQLKLDVSFSKPNTVVEVDLGSGQPCKVSVHEALRVIVDDGDGKCSEVIKDQNKSSATMAKECASRKDGCGTQTSSYPSPSNKLPEASFKVMSDYVQPRHFPARPTNYYRYVPKTAEEMDEEVEYDMDEMVSVHFKTVLFIVVVAKCTSFSQPFILRL